MRRGDEAVARTQEQLDVLREGRRRRRGSRRACVEIVRGIAAHVAGEPLPEPVEAVPLTADAVHQELSRYRYCTVFVVEGEDLDARRARARARRRSATRCSSSATRRR